MSSLDELRKSISEISVYDMSCYSAIELCYILGDKIKTCAEALNYLLEAGVKDEVVEQLNNWKNDGTLDNIINQSIFDKLSDEIKEIKSNYPKEYTPGTKVIEDNEKSRLYEGSAIFAKNYSYGRYDTAVPLSALVGYDKPYPQVLGTDTKGLSKYHNRDSVALFSQNEYRKPKYSKIENVTFNGDGMIVPTGYNLKKGMIVTTLDEPKCVGIISEINGCNITMEDGWYIINPGIGSTNRVIPTGNKIGIDLISKIWGINTNILVRNGCPAGAGLEVGVFCNHSEINDVGGVDVVNQENSTHYGVKTRGGFQKGFVSIDNGIVLEATGGNNDDIFLQSITDDGTVFNISKDGKLNRLIVNSVVASSDMIVPNNIVHVFINKANVNITLPYAELGKKLSFLFLFDGYITAPTGSGILTEDYRHQQIPINLDNGKLMKSIELISDGSMWYQVD